MIDSPVKKAEAENMIQEFTVVFYNKFGVHPVVVYEINQKKLDRMMLSFIEDVINDELAKYYASFADNLKVPTVRTRGRKRTIVTYRHLYFYFARQSGYSLESIGKRIGYDHASVIHGVKCVQDLILTNDKIIVSAYHTVEQRLSETKIIH